MIYAVELVERPGIVKYGRTSNWGQRRRHYADFNLRRGDGIARANAYLINDEWCDLQLLEAELLSRCGFPVYYKNEWFWADFDDACLVAERILGETDYSYSTITERAA